MFAGRPRTRADCIDGPRPCPWIGCKWNNYFDYLDATGERVRRNFPHLEPWQIAPERSCALDIADRGPATLDEIGAAQNITRERARQLEGQAFVHLRAAVRRMGGDDEAVAALLRRPGPRERHLG